MTSMEEGGSVELLKVDTQGRVRVSRERREALLEEYDRRGMSAAQFAEWAGIKYPTFAWWLQSRQKDRARRERVEPVGWVEAVVEAEKGGGEGKGLVVHLAGGARMEIVELSQAVLAAEVLRHLAGKTRC